MVIRVGVTRVKKRVPIIPDTSITLDTDVTSTIHNGFHGISTQEIWKLGSNVGNFRWNDNLFDPGFIGSIQELNPASLQHPGLANADLEIVNIGDTSLDQAVGTGGLNCDATSGCVVQDGLCCPDDDFGHPAFSNLLELSKQVTTSRTISVSHVLNVQVDSMVDLQTWLDQAEWKLTFCNTESIPVLNIQLGLEQNTGGNDIFWDAVGQTLNPTLPAIQTNVANYLLKVEPGVAALRALAPNAKIFFDTSPIFETTNRDLGWRKGLVNSGVLDYDGVREYMLHHSFDSINDLTEALNIKNVIIPQRLDDIDTYYSQKLIHVIYGLPDQNPTPIHDTLLGLMFITWEVQACLDWSHNNGSRLYGMNYQSLVGLINNNTLAKKVHFYGVKAIGNFLDLDDMEYVPVTLTGPNVTNLTAVCARSGSNYRLMISNYSNVDLTFENIVLDGVAVTTNDRYSVTAAALNSGTIIEQSSDNESEFIVPAYSINVFKF